MSWPEAVASIVTVICAAFVVIHLFCDGVSISVTVRHKDDRK